MRIRRRFLAMGVACSTLVAACGGGRAPPGDNTVNVYNWADYIGPDTVAQFERETGIKVHYSTFDSKEAVETVLLTGHSNYDVVVSADVFFERLVKTGAFRPLDDAALPNRKNLDPSIMDQLAIHDRGNRHGLPYLWTTVGIGYNEDKLRERIGAAIPDSWSLILDPANAARLKDCGIQVIDSPLDVLSSVLIALGKDPHRAADGDYQAAAEALMRIRPFVRSIDSSGQIGELANGTVCLILGWSGDVIQARYRALEASNGVRLRYVVPREGALISLDMMGIPADAPHPDNALKWLNYLMRPDVMAGITNAVKYPNGNLASLPLIAKPLSTDPAIYPDAETRQKLHAVPTTTSDETRLITRLWTRFRTGQ